MRYLSKHSFYIAAVITIGVILGSIICMKQNNTVDLIKYFNDTIVSGNILYKDLFLSALFKNIILWIIIFSSGFFKLGIITNIISNIYRGFLTGFTMTFIYKYFGIKGMVMCFALLPESILIFVLLLIFSSFSLKMSLNSQNSKKIFLRKYLLVGLVSISIFCVVSFVQSCLTTTFIKWIFVILGK